MSKWLHLQRNGCISNKMFIILRPGKVQFLQVGSSPMKTFAREDFPTPVEPMIIMWGSGRWVELSSGPSSGLSVCQMYFYLPDPWNVVNTSFKGCRRVMLGEKNQHNTSYIHLVFRRRGSNPQPLGCEPSAFTTIPWLLALIIFL